ncbi:MAG TPA: S8/S53 family peptidase, partial [Myxococcota bacterium]|nr:S8/S53 family peptidase [Myxococcota bacterium]
GVAASHEELKTIMYPRANADDRDGHGTACAGIADAVTENRKGIPSFNVGGRYLQVQSFPALATGAGEADDVANAIWDAVESGAAVINLSFGAKGTAPKVVARAVQAAVERDVIVVAAAGNDGQAARGQWPANLPGVVVVGATDGKLRAGFSNGTGGLARALSAPGAGICVPGPEGYRKSSGTSLAAPLVSGVLGTMRALCPRLGAAEAVEILRESGEDRTIQGLGPELRPTAALELLLRRQAACVNANIERIYDENYWENLRQQQLYREPAYNP